MKTLLTLLALVSFQHAFAQADYTNFEDGDTSLTKAQAEIISVKAICPKVPGRPSCMAFGSQVKIKITLNGCVDNYGGHFSSFRATEKTGVLSFGAINISNERSILTRCFAAPTKIIQVYVPHEGKVILEDLTYTAKAMPLH